LFKVYSCNVANIPDTCGPRFGAILKRTEGSSWTKPKRVYAAAVLSPLSILIAMPVIGIAWGLLGGYQFEFVPSEIAGWVMAGGFLLVLAYPAMLLVGVPSYLILQRFGLNTLWTAITIGYLTASVVPILLGPGGTPPSSISYWLNPLFLLGPVVGFVFWLVAKPQPETRC